MKKQSLFILFFAMLFVSVPAFSQVTGGPVLRSLYDQLKRQTTSYKVEMTGSAIFLRDKSSNAEIVSVREVDPQTVTVSGVVGNIGSAEAARDIVLGRIALFNYSSPVGSLRIDKGTGNVTMSHHLNPRHVSIASMAKVAVQCGDVARERVTGIFQ